MNLEVLIPHLKENIGRILSSKKVDSATNDVYLISSESGKFILKVIDASKRIDEDVDSILLSKLKTKYFRKLIRSYELKDEKQALLLEYLDGEILADIFKDGKPVPNNLFSQFQGFISEIASVKTKGYGAINHNLEAAFPSWKSFVDFKLKQYISSLENNSSLGKDYVGKMETFSSQISLEKPTLVPADVNLSNFLITEKADLKVLDIGVYISGDKLLPYGLLLAHSWNSDLANKILEKFSEFKSRLHFYACLEMLAIMSLTRKNYPERLNTIKPFGQKNKAIDIFKENLEYL